MGHKLIHLVSGNVRQGNWEWIGTAHDDAGNAWRRNDQRLAAKSYNWRQELKEVAQQEQHLADLHAAFNSLDDE